MLGCSAAPGPLQSLCDLSPLPQDPALLAAAFLPWCWEGPRIPLPQSWPSGHPWCHPPSPVTCVTGPRSAVFCPAAKGSSLLSDVLLSLKNKLESSLLAPLSLQTRPVSAVVIPPLSSRPPGVRVCAPVCCCVSRSPHRRSLFCDRAQLAAQAGLCTQ